jgi:hypothetical protein
MPSYADVSASLSSLCWADPTSRLGYLADCYGCDSEEGCIDPLLTLTMVCRNPTLLSSPSGGVGPGAAASPCSGVRQWCSTPPQPPTPLPPRTTPPPSKGKGIAPNKKTSTAAAGSSLAEATAVAAATKTSAKSYAETLPWFCSQVSYVSQHQAIINAILNKAG